MVQFVNGDFELGSNPTNFQLADTQAELTALAPGWTLVSGSVDEVGPSFPFNPFHSQVIDLHGSSIGAISQTLDTTAEIGETIIFNMDAGGVSAGSTATFQVIVNGVPLIPVGETSSVINPPDGTIVTYQYSFVATGSDTVLIQGASGASNSGVYVDNFNVVCFAAGSRIQTPLGKVPVSEIKIGNKVTTADGRHLPVRWVGRRKVSYEQLRVNPKLKPVFISAGALGNGLPRRDLLVSRQHRMLVCSKIAERMFGEKEVLVPAIKLAEIPGIYVDESAIEVEYVHLLFNQHEIIYAEGAPSESLFTGREALKAISPEARAEIMTMFPEVADINYRPEPARLIPPGKLQKQLIARHCKTQKPLLEAM